jgi:hypothetical protein
LTEGLFFVVTKKPITTLFLIFSALLISSVLISSVHIIGALS